jgi:hypothetical protein
MVDRSQVDGRQAEELLAVEATRSTTASMIDGHQVLNACTEADPNCTEVTSVLVGLRQVDSRQADGPAVDSRSPSTAVRGRQVR